MTERNQDQACPGCGEVYYRPCRISHRHDDAFFCDIDMTDVRQFPCGCYGHKGCQKEGLHDCRPDPENKELKALPW